MTSQNHAHATTTTGEALILAMETAAELADLVHRHRLACARLRAELSELADALRQREASATLQAEAPSQDRRQALATLALASDADYQALRRRERELRREAVEREADIERARFRLRLTLALLPTAQAVDGLEQAFGAQEEDVP